MADFILKTVRFPNNKMMENFISKQSNFSKAMRYLVIKYCQETGYDNIEDLSVAYNNLLYEVPSETKVASEPLTNQMEVIKEKTKTVNNTHNQISSLDTVIQSKITSPISEIPSCYQ